MEARRCEIRGCFLEFLNKVGFLTFFAVFDKIHQPLCFAFCVLDIFRKAIPLNVILSKEQGDASEESRRRTAFKNLKTTTLNRLNA